MSEQLKVAYQTTTSVNHSCNQVVYFTPVSFHLRKLHFYQCIPANSLTSGANHLPADMKLYNYILLVFTEQEVNVERYL